MKSQNIVRLFDSATAAKEAGQRLTAAGLAEANVHIICSPNDPGCAPAATEPRPEVLEELLAAGLPEREARQYVRQVESGKAVLVAAADPAQCERFELLLRGRGGESAAAAPGAGEVREEVVEEEMVVGKREVETGGVRIETTVSEKPVEQEVTLREERVEVERRPVDRPAGDAEFAPGRGAGGRVFELRETHEEPVVSKRAKVVEEVVVRKESGERTETVRDTVRRRDVNITPIQPGGEARHARREEEFRRQYEGSLAGSGYTYEQAAPAFRYGADLAQDQRYAGRDWDALEPDARQAWEEKNPGTWEHLKRAVRDAWQGVKGKK